MTWCRLQSGIKKIINLTLITQTIFVHRIGWSCQRDAGQPFEGFIRFKNSLGGLALISKVLSTETYEEVERGDYHTEHVVKN